MDIKGGCDGTTDGSDTGANGTDTPEDLALSSVTPPYGHSSGGYTIVLDGEGFSEDTTVRIGGDAAEVLSLSERRIEVAVPARDPGPSDVRVARQDGQTTRLEDAFEYFQDAGGAVQLFVDLNREEASVDGYTERTYGAARWVEDTDLTGWASYGPTGLNFDEETEHGGCNGGFDDFPLSVVDGDYPDIYFSGSGLSFSFQDNGRGKFDLEDFNWGPETNPVPVSALDLETYSFTEQVILSLEDALLTPNQVVFLEEEDCTGCPSQDPTTSSNEFPGDFVVKTVGSPTGEHSSNKLLIRANILSPEGESTIGRVACVAKDDGHFRVDKDAWDLGGSWIEDAEAFVWIGRMQTTDTVLPHTNGIARVSVVHWVEVQGLTGVFKSSTE